MYFLSSGVKGLIWSSRQFCHSNLDWSLSYGLHHFDPFGLFPIDHLTEFHSALKVLKDEGAKHASYPKQLFDTLQQALKGDRGRLTEVCRASWIFIEQQKWEVGTDSCRSFIIWWDSPSSRKGFLSFCLSGRVKHSRFSQGWTAFSPHSTFVDSNQYVHSIMLEFSYIIKLYWCLVKTNDGFLFIRISERLECRQDKFICPTNLHPDCALVRNRGDCN